MSRTNEQPFRILGGAAAVAGLLLGMAALSTAQKPAPESFEALARAAAAAVESDPERSVTLARKGLELRPEWPEGWFYLGGALYRLKRYPEAVDAFHKGLARDPGNPVGWAILGLSEAELGRSPEALSDIQKGETLGLGSLSMETAVRQKAATILIGQSAFDRAVTQLQPLAQRHVDTPALVALIGLCALTDARRPEEVPPARRPVVMAAGRALWAAIGRQPPKETEENFRQLVAAYPKEPGVHYAYGLFLLNGPSQESALPEFQKETAANPSHWPSLLSISYLETKQDHPELGLRAAEKARQSAPDAYRWLCDAEMGRALLAMDQPEKAVPLFEESARLKADNARTHFYLAKAYRKVGRKADAEKQDAEFMRLGAEQDPAAFPGSAPQ